MPANRRWDLIRGFKGKQTVIGEVHGPVTSRGRIGPRHPLNRRLGELHTTPEHSREYRNTCLMTVMKS